MNISFFLPAYNCANTIDEAVSSILKTNFIEGDELIIVNDSSTDNTSEVLYALKDTFPFIKIITHQRNKGGAAARNTAVENSINDLLFCLDSDNVLAPNSIHALKEYLLIENADVAVFQDQHFFTTDKLIPHYTWSLPCGVFNNNLYLNGGNTPGQHGNYLFTKNSWIKAKGYAEGTGALDTFTFGLRQAITGSKKVILKDSFYYHRLGDDSYWMNDAEKNIWSVSLKVTFALYPFFDYLDQGFIEYMLGKGKYIWFYKRYKRPIKLENPLNKVVFYNELQKSTYKIVYPPQSLFTRIFKKLQKTI